MRTRYLLDIPRTQPSDWSITWHSKCLQMYAASSNHWIKYLACGLRQMFSLKRAGFLDKTLIQTRLKIAAFSTSRFHKFFHHVSPRKFISPQVFSLEGNVDILVFDIVIHISNCHRLRIAVFTYGRVEALCSHVLPRIL